MSEWVLTDVAELLEEAAVGVLGASLFAGRLPPTPDACVAVCEVLASERRVRGYASPDVTIVARALAYADAEAKATACYNAVRVVRNQVLASGVRYVSIEPLSPPVNARRDEQGRSVMSFVCRAWKNDTPS